MGDAHKILTTEEDAATSIFCASSVNPEAVRFFRTAKVEQITCNKERVQSTLCYKVIEKKLSSKDLAKKREERLGPFRR